MGKRNLKERRKQNKIKLQQAKEMCASFVGLTVDKYSALEIVICVSQKLDKDVRGDIHPNQQILHLAKIINRKPCVVVNKTKKEFFDSRAWKILRYQAFEKYGNRCQCCGARPSDGIALHVDHVKPKSTHPELSLDLNNLQILCEDCNIGKINQFDTDWRYLPE
jgi:5-methylcytosine-specific restriction endonuclease McrA